MFMRFLGLILAACILAFWGWVQHDQIQPGPYIYDEADYMHASSLGLASNAWDTPSMPIWDFVSLGLSAVRNQESRTRLSEQIREGTDVNFYRHTHGPLYYYWLWLCSHWALTEEAMRAWSQLFAALTIVGIFYGCTWVIPGAAGVYAGVISAALYATSPAVIGTRELAPHLLFGLCSLASMFCAAKALRTGDRKMWYAALIATGLAIASLEVAFVGVLTLIALGWRGQKQLGLDRKAWLVSAGMLAGTVLVVWPAALLKLSMAKSYMFMAYLAVARNGAWGDVTFWGTWAHRFASSPVEWACIGLALALWMGQKSARASEALPFLVFGGLMVLTILRVNTVSLRYAVPFLPALHVFSGIMLGTAAERLTYPQMRWGAVAAALVLLAWNAERFRALHPMKLDAFTISILQSVRDQNLTQKRLLVPHDELPTLRYYFPKARVNGYLEPPPQQSPPVHDAMLAEGETRFVEYVR